MPLFPAAILLSAALLFWAELLVGKLVLPKFGGGPAVWNTCVLFFQAVLLLGYGYVHWFAARRGLRRQVLWHAGLALLPLAVLPLAVPADWVPPAGVHPILCLLGYLLVTAGLPLFVVSTTTPLLQQWFSATGHARAGDPYYLYAASNLGSLVGLLGYPLLIEPAVGLRRQGWLWAGGYGLLAVLVGACAAAAWRGGAAGGVPGVPAGPGPAAEPPTARTRLTWLALAFVPSSLTLGVTTYFTADVCPVPMIWVVPLGLYLLTFVLAFGGTPAWLHRTMTVALPVLALLLAARAFVKIPAVVTYLSGMKVLVPLHLATLFAAGMVLHGRLARLRPAVVHLTGYYFWISLGGVLGGVFNALVAPLVFPSSLVEYHAGLVLAVLLGVPWRAARDPRRGRRLDLAVPVLLALLTPALLTLPSHRAPAVRYGLPVLVCLVCLARPVRLGLCLAVLFVSAHAATAPGFHRLHRGRNFFGVLTVLADDEDHIRQLYDGNTMHGAQMRGDLALRRFPLLYYDPSGPAGQTFAAFAADHPRGRVAVVGLGAGSLAAYGRPGQEFTFFELNPAVEHAARRSFTYLADSPAGCRVVLGDARLSLGGEPDGSFDMIVLDAFSSDAIPVHLLTEEAVRVYLRKLAPGGILLCHISNRYVDLEPVLAGLARALNLRGVAQEESRVSPQEQARGKKPSHWVALARGPGPLGGLLRNPRWRPVRWRKDVAGWSDDHSNLLGLLKWD
jgi:SAM-dependent methyltransferase